ncbi:MAG: nucleotidyltransferase family protein [Prevotella sp.]
MEVRLFFEFLQVAIGNRESLSRELSDNEWQDIFRLLKEHALLGVGFTAVERLHAKGVVCPMQLRMQWYALVVQIERRNEQLNGLCKKMTEQYEHDGLSTCILKGQGNQLNYPENLRMRRMSGDIDIWCLPPKEGLDIAVHTGRNSVEYVKYHGVRAVIEYVKLQHRICGSNKKPRPIYHHVDAPAIECVEVEAHFRTGYIHSPLRNWRMQRWFAQHHEGCATNKTFYGFSMPTSSVNVIYQMTHLFSHYFQEGVGLRQILDMYFTLTVWRESVENGYGQQSQGMWSEGLGTPVMSAQEVMEVLRSFGMGKFAGAVMWVLKEVFFKNEETTFGGRRESQCRMKKQRSAAEGKANEECSEADEVSEQQLSSIGQQLKEKCVCEPWMICEPNEKEGRKLLAEIMQGGNFGQYDTRDAALKKGGMVKHGVWKLKRVLRLVRSYPEEALWESVFRVWHLGWRLFH